MTSVHPALLLFLGGAAVLLYVLFFYPAILSLIRRGKGPASSSSNLHTVSVILPVRNGEKWLDQKLRSILALDYPPELMQILVISDGSTDRTESIALSFASRVQLLSISAGGKAAAINEALKQATGDILFFNDVRQELSANALRSLVVCFNDPDIGVASGELIIRKGDSTEEENVGLYWQYEKWIRKRHSHIDSVMGATGAIYCMRRSLAAPLPPNTLLDDVYLPMGAFFKGYRVIFVDEARAYDSPTALDTEFRRKVRTLAGLYQLIGEYPQLLGPSNRMWIHFVSHKLGRLLLPFALIVMLLSGLFLPQPWAVLVTAAQLAFYAMAFVDKWMPERTPLKKISSIVRTFVVMMWAALCATSILFVPSESFWKSPTKTT